MIIKEIPYKDGKENRKILHHHFLNKPFQAA